MPLKLDSSAIGNVQEISFLWRYLLDTYRQEADSQIRSKGAGATPQYAISSSICVVLKKFEKFTKEVWRNLSKLIV